MRLEKPVPHRQHSTRRVKPSTLTFHIRRDQPTFITFGTCEGDAECVEAPSKGKRSDDGLNLREDARPTQGADGAEEVPGALRAGEQLAPRALKWLRLPLHGHPAHRLNIQDMCGSRSIRHGV